MASFRDRVKVDGQEMTLYVSQADRDSWPRTLAFFAKHLGRVPVAAG